MSLFRRPFADVITRQLTLFEREHAALLAACANARRAYDEADRDEAEERYGDYLDLLSEGTAALAELRDHYAAALEELVAGRYVGEFNRAVRRRLPPFALELDET
jgi:hypothetical protein